MEDPAGCCRRIYLNAKQIKITPYTFLFSQDHTCIKWLDYMLARQEFEKAAALCHGNWIEIQCKTKYIQTLQAILDKQQISYPEEI